MRPLKYGAVLAQEPFTHAAQGAQEVSQVSLDSFEREGIHIAYTIAIIITRPLVLSVSDGRVCRRNPMVTAVGIIAALATKQPAISVAKVQAHKPGWLEMALQPQEAEAIIKEVGKMNARRD